MNSVVVKAIEEYLHNCSKSGDEKSTTSWCSPKHSVELWWPLISGFQLACSIYASNLDSDELQTLPGCRLPQEASAIEELHDWSLNFQTGLNPYCLFVDIIGYSVDRWGDYAYQHDVKNCGEIFGYKELCLLADALKLFENNGYDQVYEWCDALNESEETD